MFRQYLIVMASFLILLIIPWPGSGEQFTIPLVRLTAMGE
jgi:hypothetical protein